LRWRCEGVGSESAAGNFAVGAEDFIAEGGEEHGGFSLHQGSGVRVQGEPGRSRLEPWDLPGELWWPNDCPERAAEWANVSAECCEKGPQALAMRPRREFYPIVGFEAAEKRCIKLPGDAPYLAMRRNEVRQATERANSSW